eukprot:768820-Hanusia_phi.AAC.6
MICALPSDRIPRQVQRADVAEGVVGDRGDEGHKADRSHSHCPQIHPLLHPVPRHSPGQVGHALVSHVVVCQVNLQLRVFHHALRPCLHRLLAQPVVVEEDALENLEQRIAIDPRGDNGGEIVGELEISRPLANVLVSPGGHGLGARLEDVAVGVGEVKEGNDEVQEVEQRSAQLHPLVLLVHTPPDRLPSLTFLLHVLVHHVQDRSFVLLAPTLHHQLPILSFSRRLRAPCSLGSTKHVSVRELRLLCHALRSAVEHGRHGGDEGFREIPDCEALARGLGVSVEEPGEAEEGGRQQVLHRRRPPCRDDLLLAVVRELPELFVVGRLEYLQGFHGHGMVDVWPMPARVVER